MTERNAQGSLGLLAAVGVLTMLSGCQSDPTVWTGPPPFPATWGMIAGGDGELSFAVDGTVVVRDLPWTVGQMSCDIADAPTRSGTGTWEQRGPGQYVMVIDGVEIPFTYRVQGFRPDWGPFT